MSLPYGPDFFDEAYYARGGSYDSYVRADLQRAKWLIRTFNPIRVLDIGCGRGTLVRWLNDLGSYAVGLDISRYGLGFIPNMGVLGDDRCLPFQSNSFDLVCGFDILEHNPEEFIDQIIREVARVCSKNAFFNVALEGTTDRKVDPTHYNLKARRYWIEKFSEYFEVLPCDSCPTLLIKEAQFKLKKRGVDGGSYIKWLRRQEETFAEDSVIEEVLGSPIQRERVDVAVSWIGSNELVLDIGGGDGAISELIYNKGNTVVTLDFPRVIATAKSRKFLLLVAAEATYLPFKSESMDTVFAGEIIEHLLDVERFLAEIHRVLKPDGKLILTTPNIVRLRNRLAMLLGDVTPWHEWQKTFTHLRYFTPNTLMECLEQNGFQPIKYGAGRSLGEGPPVQGWDMFNEEEKQVLKGILQRFTPHPLFLLSFICVLAKKV